MRFRKRFTLRRRLMEFPLPKRIRLAGPGQDSKARRRGSATMDYFLGPVELLRAIAGGAQNRCTADLALHTTEATLYLQNAGEVSTTYRMQTRCDPLPPLDWARALR